MLHFVWIGRRNGATRPDRRPACRRPRRWFYFHHKKILVLYRVGYKTNMGRKPNTAVPRAIERNAGENGWGVGAPLADLVENLCHAEVGEFRHPVLGEQHVFRLQVSMADVVPVQELLHSRPTAQHRTEHPQGTTTEHVAKTGGRAGGVEKTDGNLAPRTHTTRSRPHLVDVRQVF